MLDCGHCLVEIKPVILHSLWTYRISFHFLRRMIDHPYLSTLRCGTMRLPSCDHHLIFLIIHHEVKVTEQAKPDWSTTNQLQDIVRTSVPEFHRTFSGSTMPNSLEYLSIQMSQAIIRHFAPQLSQNLEPLRIYLKQTLKHQATPMNLSCHGLLAKMPKS